MESISLITSRSYLVYLVFFLPAVLLDLFWPLDLFPAYLRYAGAGLALLAPVLLYRAQRSAAAFRARRACGAVGPEAFACGPYGVSRSPTQLGLAMLFGGLALAAGAPFILLAALGSFLVVRLAFTPRMEAVLERRYGEAYRCYKRRVGALL